MNVVKQLAIAFGAVAVMAGAARPASPVGDVGPAVETMSKVRRTLERLPYYGVFDFLAFTADDKAVTLKGYAHRPALKKEAADMVRRATGLEVANQIEVLPASALDDDIRWETYLRIYTDDFASRYVSGGGQQVRYELIDMTRFPGMEPFGNHAIHIVVKNRRVALFGVVTTESDKTSLLIRARQVGHTLAVEDVVTVRGL